jgi:uncharacterized protein YjbI with pentapeptide repeats
MSLWAIGGIGGAIFVAAVVPGMLLWWPSRHHPDARSGFGVSLVTGAVVALAIFALQMLFEMRLDHVDQQRQQQVNRQNLELTIGLQTSLPGIQLHDEQLDGFFFYGKNLRAADFQGTSLTSATFTGSDLSCANLRGAVLRDITAQRVRLRGTILEGADLTRAILSEAARGGNPCSGSDHTKLTDAILVEAELDNAHLEESSFQGANLRDADLNASHLEGSDFSSARLKDATLEGAYLDGALLSGADLTGATLRGATLTGATYDSHTKWPARYEQRPCAASKLCTVGGDVPPSGDEHERATHVAAAKLR